jgi:hypothetical protein
MALPRSACVDPTDRLGQSSFYEGCGRDHIGTARADPAIGGEGDRGGLTDAEDGFLNGSRYLIHDRDPLFSKSFRKTLGSSGVETVKLPARSPNLNARAERFVRSVKSECLARIIPLGERHLRHAVTQYMEHYHVERNH